MTLPWNERVPMLSYHPDAATRDDIARLAGDLMEANATIARKSQAVAPEKRVNWARAWDTMREEILAGLDGFDNDSTNQVLGVLDDYDPRP